MNKHEIPVEIAGYATRWIIEKDDVKRTFRLRPISYLNENYTLDDLSECSPGDLPNDCPF
jgi:hypothetical protein